MHKFLNAVVSLQTNQDAINYVLTQTDTLGKKTTKSYEHLNCEHTLADSIIQQSYRLFMHILLA